MIGCFNRSVILTYVGGIFALIGIYCTAAGRTDIALICLILAGICDLFDGFIARKCKRNETQKAFGVQIDSLIDVVSFLLFPAFLLFSIPEAWMPVKLTVGAVYVLCGVNRLAWFNITQDTFQNVYRGLPVTYAALALPVWYVLIHYISRSGIADSGRIAGIALPAAYVLLGVLFILNIRIPKPGPKMYPLFVVLAAVLIVILLRSYEG